ncbi:hypothetical protein ALMP_38950 [Streptomyces sp. A012304]|nr:hypothetical protein ALMP_38950 [Streptomyces sp. A012304]
MADGSAANAACAAAGLAELVEPPEEQAGTSRAASERRVTPVRDLREVRLMYIPRA